MAVPSPRRRLKKIIYVSHLPLTDRVSRDWCFGHLLDSGVPAEFWDVCAVWPVGLPPTPSGRAGLVLIPTLKELTERLARPENAGACFVLNLDHDARCRFQRLTRGRRLTAMFSWGQLPIPPRSLGEKVAALLRSPRRAPAAVWDKAAKALMKRTGAIRPVDIVFAGGKAAAEAHPDARRIVPINQCDYDLYREAVRDPGRPVAGRFAVFMDNNQARNPDVDVVGLPRLDAARYLSSLNRFFGLVEKRFGIPLVVAAHPSSDYAPGAFEGRRILKGRTAALVRDAEFAIGHHSSSISYAVLGLKPLLFIYTGEMAALYRHAQLRYIRAIAGYLGAPVLNADEVRSAEEIRLAPVDEARYRDYKYRFLTTPESENAFNRDIVLRELKALDAPPGA